MSSKTRETQKNRNVSKWNSRRANVVWLSMFLIISSFTFHKSLKWHGGKSLFCVNYPFKMNVDTLSCTQTRCQTSCGGSVGQAANHCTPHHSIWHGLDWDKVQRRVDVSHRGRMRKTQRRAWDVIALNGIQREALACCFQMMEDILHCCFRQSQSMSVLYYKEQGTCSWDSSSEWWLPTLF